MPYDLQIVVDLVTYMLMWSFPIAVVFELALKYADIFLNFIGSGRVKL